MNEILLRLDELLFPSIADVAVLSVDVNIAIVRVDVRCTATGASCPGCGGWSAQVHGSYLWFPADLPSAGRRVVLQLRVRRFACRNAGCGRRTFVEQIPGLTRRHGQRTERLRSTLAAIGLAAEGATVGAPQAVQVADRWHLWHNLSEAAERSIAQHRQCLRVLVPQTTEPT
ncbi:transposase family protein [Streptomyces sp. NPDC003038]|uniref:transposase family protein n=1 Tax=unclassified Streptomyces TaxID=2593676 RepID=UPI0033A2448C